MGDHGSFYLMLYTQENVETDLTEHVNLLRSK